ncbi:hypothetical protein [Candidatus Chlorohelix sp.]|uniref:tetratricopeptide repeat protein n=1 Tax=Candidatus Chlorohelix sp. TaxID=3139201 RepID=UPI00303B9E3D
MEKNISEFDKLLKDGYRLLDEASVSLTPQQAIHHCGEALAIFKKTLEIATEEEEPLQAARKALADAYSQRGHQQRYIHKYKEAVTDLTQSIRLNPALAEDYYYRAMSHLKIDDRSSARNDLTQYLRYGKVEYLRESAQKYLTELAPRTDNLAYAAHLAKEGARLSSEATSLLNPKEGIQPDSAGAVRLYNQSIDTFRKALELSPKDFLAHIGLLAALKDQAEAYLAIQEYDLTIQNLNEALKLKPNLSLLFRRGEVYKLSGHREHAVADFTEFLQTSTNGELKQSAEKYLRELQQTKSGAE